ncbi:ubiquinone biosynthesis protein COQ4 homolog, mitochondrial-like [Biomphalaria glabrata]|uniref:Ubiquinone biosynthesis protein COQ4 homolog, mitochondrial n=2 Tax=Biomphalaria glabrata TaxID=6526 RepID=A0A9W3BFW7_BIOGL|nr:ubiquinone biosynthesis protein COQ4 homolog, mitochondrial-like [Biomphalaria glabrata]XP_055898333.1 ubiquinone biosynthesis protein COQ4 homolog, mitochondrial-like [Biomphalaria glabrata]XP_055898334.1 ubiquinone biosynthesis protein COQ4 homolog, mitochondrial-like [Biomphalaria glabrata]XP_055898335.1 ubiquinone biosynthesis protein COQ4 homolog, mitochondrial-like [Biomphalaria glabrata]XP_055898336.1 ubiquinone biosynthesis protein COQ4 homolog, mitochondrial-like [Biomphalaria glabr
MSRNCVFTQVFVNLQKMKGTLNSTHLNSFRTLRISSVISNDINNEVPSNTSHQQYDMFYPGHISTSLFQKSLLAAGSGIACLLNPARDDMLCALGETTGPLALKYIHSKMMSDSVGRQILEEKPVINTTTINLEKLGSLPDGTFGKEYWTFLKTNGFSPDARRPVNFIDDAELMYVMLRYRQCHDLVHTLLGMPPNMLGEVAVKWFEAIQTRLPMCISAALFGPIRLGPKHRRKYFDIYLPWAIRSAYNSKFLMNVYFEKHWEQDITEFRQELNLEPAPVPLIKTGKNTKTK